MAGLRHSLQSLERDPYSGVVLVASTDVRMREDVLRVVQDLGARTRVADNRAIALRLARMDPPAVVATTVDLDGRTAGLSLARACVRQYGSGVVFVGDRLSDRLATAVAALDASFLVAPLRTDQLRATLRLLLARAAFAASARSGDDRHAEAGRALRQIAAIVASSGALGIDTAPATTPAASLATLRPREQEVVSLLAGHHRIPEIATRMGISPNTVRNHLKNVYRRFRVRSQQQLLRRLREMAEASRQTG